MKTKKQEESIAAGGQAVIEGVMMRSAQTAIAVRKHDGTITIKHVDKPMLIKRRPFLGTPFIRGVFVLYDSLVMGLNAISFSAQASSEGTSEELNKKDIVFAMLMAVGLAIGLFIVTPLLVTSLFGFLRERGGLFALVEGLIRATILVLYIWIISRSKDIQRVFAYHGAEHKTVHAYEKKEELTIENARRYSRIHPRCGTSFLAITVISAIVVLGVVGVIWPLNFWQKLLVRLAFLPVIASLAFEFQRFTSKFLENPFVRIFALPGMWLQRLTTAEPDDKQLQVAIVSLKSALGMTPTPQELGIPSDQAESDGTKTTEETQQEQSKSPEHTVEETA